MVVRLLQCYRQLGRLQMAIVDPAGVAPTGLVNLIVGKTVQSLREFTFTNFRLHLRGFTFTVIQPDDEAMIFVDRVPPDPKRG